MLLIMIERTTTELQSVMLFSYIHISAVCCAPTLSASPLHPLVSRHPESDSSVAHHHQVFHDTGHHCRSPDAGPDLLVLS